MGQEFWSNCIFLTHTLMVGLMVGGDAAFGSLSQLDTSRLPLL
jgi:hypothetical protein